MLRSKLLSGNQRLIQCETQDAAHVKLGDRGDYVSLIQRALQQIEGSRIADSELKNGIYSTTTAAAVLAYKTKRNIVNTAYQTRPDDIVGKMTIRSLDTEMQALEVPEPTAPFFAAEFRPVRGRLI
jgi:peptidoglycan hydrolase-like protein with peptidoglycan-binding domain